MGPGSSRACIAITVLIAVLEIPCVRLTAYSNNYCLDDSDCDPSLTSSKLLLCKCATQEEREEHDTSWLQLTSCCNVIPEPFHWPKVRNVVYIENYTTTYPDESSIKISVWSKLNNSFDSTHTDEWKLLRILAVRFPNSASAVAETMTLVDTLLLSDIQKLNQTLHDGSTEAQKITAFNEPLSSLKEGIRESNADTTALEVGIRQLAESGGNAVTLDHSYDIPAKCACYHCMAVVNQFEIDYDEFAVKDPGAVSLSEDSSQRAIPNGYYLTGIGMFAERITVSSNWSSFHGPVNGVDEWQEGTAGGWSPDSSDANMSLTFENLNTTICGLVIQGMASTTLRSLNFFQVEDGFVDNGDSDAIIYFSGVALNAKSSHYFPLAVPASHDLRLKVLRPLDPFRVGFRVSLMACDNSALALPVQDSAKCLEKTVIEEIKMTIAVIEDIGAVQDQAETSLAVFDIIKELATSDRLPDEPFVVVVDKSDELGVEINIQGVKSTTLKSEGFVYRASPEEEEAEGNDRMDEAVVKTSITIPQGAFDGLPTGKDGGQLILVTVAVSKMSENLTSVKLDEDKSETIIGSSIVQLNVFTDGGLFQIPAMNYSVATNENVTEDALPVCAYFNETESRSVGRVQWRTEGCELLDYSLNLSRASCFCNHSTSYAILFKVTASRSSELDALASAITTVGLSLSIVALSIALLVLFLIRSRIAAMRYAIHANLMMSLWLSSALFVSGILRTKNELICTIVKFLYQYLFMAAFCWMLTEGIHLYRQIITVFESARKKNWIYFMVGWGLPLLVVIITVGLTVTPMALVPLSGDASGVCLFTYEDGSVWFVLGPVMVIILVNIGILVLVTAVVVRAVQFQSDKNTAEKMKQAKAALRSALLLMPLLGSTYVVGPLTSLHEALEIAFIIVNSLQGFLIALFYCAMNKEVRTAVQLHLKCGGGSTIHPTAITQIKNVNTSSKSKNFIGSKTKVAPEPDLDSD